MTFTCERGRSACLVSCSGRGPGFSSTSGHLRRLWLMTLRRCSASLKTEIRVVLCVFLGWRGLALELFFKIDMPGLIFRVFILVGLAMGIVSREPRTSPNFFNYVHLSGNPQDEIFRPSAGQWNPVLNPLTWFSPRWGLAYLPWQRALSGPTDTFGPRHGGHPVPEQDLQLPKHHLVILPIQC